MTLPEILSARGAGPKGGEDGQWGSGAVGQWGSGAVGWESRWVDWGFRFFWELC